MTCKIRTHGADAVHTSFPDDVSVTIAYDTDAILVSPIFIFTTLIDFPVQSFLFGDFLHWINYRIQGYSFPYHLITKATLVICLVQQKILTNLNVLALYGPEFYSYSLHFI